MQEKNFGYLGVSFQQNLIKCIIEDKKYGETIIDVIESKYFDNNSFKYIMENLKELYKEYTKIPDYTSLAQKILIENSNNRETSKVHLDTLEAIKINKQDSGFVKDTALNFCKQQNLKKELKQVNTIIENGDFEEYSKIETIIRNALQVGTSNDDVIDVFFDIESSLSKDYRHTIPTGINGLDNALKGGLGKGELGVMLMATGIGKALPISCPILTPNGWINIGDIKVDDDVIGSDGKKQKVIGVYPQGIRPIYKMEFTDGTSVECDEEHLWSVNSRNDDYNTFKVLKTSNLIEKSHMYNHYRLPSIKPIEFNEIYVDVDPYEFGVSLNKDSLIPHEYLYNSLENRIKLLNGIIDSSCGRLQNNRRLLFLNNSKTFCKDLKELVLSLGGYTTGINDNFDVNFIFIELPNNINPFSDNFVKNKHFNKNEIYKKRKFNLDKFIKSINYSHDEEAICIKVDNKDELFVIKDYVLTHNTTALTKVANTAHQEGYNVLQIFFEDNPSSIKRKHYTIWSGIAPDEQSYNVEEVMEKVQNAQNNSIGQLRLLKLPSDGTTITDIRNKVRKMISDGFKIDLLIIDYVDCISSKSGDEEWKGEGAIMRALETMASEFEFALWTAVQGSRSAISSEIVTTDQMGGSIKKAQIAHVIISVGKTLEQKEHNLATMTILKSRIGKDGIIFQNCKYDNEFLIIDTESQNTLLGVEQDKEVDKTKRLRDAYDRQQQNK